MPIATKISVTRRRTLAVPEPENPTGQAAPPVSSIQEPRILLDPETGLPIRQALWHAIQEFEATLRSFLSSLSARRHPARAEPLPMSAVDELAQMRVAILAAVIRGDISARLALHFFKFIETP